MTRRNPLSDLVHAFALLTVVPTGSASSTERGPQTAAWFPVVGALFGFVGYAEAKAAGLIHVQARASYLVAALIVVSWAVLSRMLHWDGLADIGDALWGSHDRDRRLEIMADSHTGAFGATTVALIAIVEVLAIGTMLARPHELPIMLIPVLSRFSATAGSWLGTPARPSGLAHSVIAHPSGGSVIIGLAPVVAVLTVLWLTFHVAGLAVGAFGVLVAFAIPHLLAERFGGVTGDVLGASVLLTETIVFAAFALGV